MDVTCQECGKIVTRKAKANVWKGERVVCTGCLKRLECQDPERLRAAVAKTIGRAGAPWLVHDGQEQHGPYTTEQMIELLQCGRVDWLWNIWQEGMTRWRAAGNLFTIPQLANGRFELRDFGQGDGTYRNARVSQ